MIYVVGSGPAGVACAFALVKMGLDVTMLDAGFYLEIQRGEVVAKLGQLQPEEWDETSVRLIKDKMTTKIKGVERKYLFGSDFPYRDALKHVPIEGEQVNITPSLAKGGFSNVWGAGVLPYIASDIVDWPITISDLAPHYQSVFSFMNLAATRDDLELIFPLYNDTTCSLQPSQQAQKFMNNLIENQKQLYAEGIFFGYSRLAVQVNPQADKPGCTYCGMCMYGCPYYLIYSSSFTLETLKRYPNFRYVSGIVVEKVSEAQGSATIYGRLLKNDEEITLKGERVYLACGALPTTKILLESMEVYNKPVTLKDSLYFLLPLLRYEGVKQVSKEKLYTLSQIFMEIQDPKLSEKTIHLQIYTYNDLYWQAIKELIGPLVSIMKCSIEEVLGRLLIVQGFMPSDISPSISVQLLRGEGYKSSYLVLEPNSAVSKQNRVVKQFISKLFRHRNLLKAWPVSPFHTIMKPGSSFHYGGTFPMTTTPKPFESDILGRPFGFEKIHVVDSTTFPSIPATTITLSIMANAYRIASAYHQT